MILLLCSYIFFTIMEEEVRRVRSNFLLIVSNEEPVVRFFNGTKKEGNVVNVRDRDRGSRDVYVIDDRESA